MMVHVHTIVFVIPVVQHWVEREMALLGKHTHCVVSDHTCRHSIITALLIISKQRTKCRTKCSTKCRPFGEIVEINKLECIFLVI